MCISILIFELWHSLFILKIFSNGHLLCLIRGVEEHKTEPIKFDSQENGFVNDIPPQGVPDGSGSRPETVREGSETTQKVLSEGPLSGRTENQRSTNHFDVNGHGQGRDMEKALEDKAQLIDQYEEMEKAQREWEEKFRENNNSTPVYSLSGSIYVRISCFFKYWFIRIQMKIL